MVESLLVLLVEYRQLLRVDCAAGLNAGSAPSLDQQCARSITNLFVGHKPKHRKLLETVRLKSNRRVIFEVPSQRSTIGSVGRCRLALNPTDPPRELVILFMQNYLMVRMKPPSIIISLSYERLAKLMLNNTEGLLHQPSK